MSEYTYLLVEYQKFGYESDERKIKGFTHDSEVCRAWRDSSNMGALRDCFPIKEIKDLKDLKL
ncbi:hypothetical protein M0R04_04910 [Candidatus Dojkabacteria bacterium]|jgi:hypothetical protein|nr:hypothetical protein [Candidatus Dojkabacteria bacterium]